MVIMAKEKLADKIGDEVIMYGGLPLRRKDVYKDVMLDFKDKKMADTFAFNPRSKVVNMKPYSLTQFRKITRRKKR